MPTNHAAMRGTTTSFASDADLRITFDRHFAVELASSPRQLGEVMALRYQVYCCEREFENAESFPDDREHDDYDTRSVHALVRHRASGDCVAAVRLVLANLDDPSALFPVEEHCSDALPEGGMAQIEREPRLRVAEISRLAVSRDIRQRMTSKGNDADPPERDAQPHIVVGLFAAIVQWSAKLGITHWMAVMEPASLRLLCRYGIHFSHVGSIINYHGRRKPVVAQARALVDGIKHKRPDVWNLITASGCVLPDQPLIKRAHVDRAIIPKAPPPPDHYWPIMRMDGTQAAVAEQP